jgi:DNA-3-methyladenine glycosylase
MGKIDRDFCLQETTAAARGFLGKVLVHESPRGRMAGRIVETEAYTSDDPACHACRGLTKRNAAMFGEPGHAYVYFTYGFHHCLNFVTQPKGIAEAVLIRALEPIEGIDLMWEQRQKGTHPFSTQQRDASPFLCSGPGKLTQAMGIDLSLNGADLLGDVLYVLDDSPDLGEIVARPRIGIKEATDRLWRFYPSNFRQWVSKP